MDKCLKTEIPTDTGWKQVRVRWCENAGRFFGETDYDKGVMFGEMIAYLLPGVKPDTLLCDLGSFGEQKELKIIARYGDKFPDDTHVGGTA